MSRKYFLAVLLVTLLCLFLILIFFERSPVAEKKETVSNTPARLPYPAHISGVGVVEPKSGNIYIGIPFNRIVKKIHVSVNEPVKKGDVIIQFENQDLVANLQVKKSEYEKAVANLHKLEEMPRKEDLTIAEEALEKAKVALNEAKTQYDMVLNLANRRAISKEEQDKRQYRVLAAEAQIKEVQAQYEKIKSGTWEPDLKIAQQQVVQAEADIAAITAEIERTAIKSPIDGTILQIKIHEGETPTSDISPTAIIVGDLSEYYLRVSIDQFNVSKFAPTAKAVAYRQGDRSNKIPLEIVHVEPFMIPKKYFTNSVDEKVDTQVFEILYKIMKKDPGLLIGEKMDVFIEKQK